MQAIRIIQDEHRSLAAVLHGMLYLVREIRDRGMKPPFEVLGAMVYYIDAFPERFHHPKEDGYLFLRLRARCPEARRCSIGSRRSTAPAPRRSARSSRALARYQQGGDAEAEPFIAAVRGLRRHSTGSTWGARRRKCCRSPRNT